jgi:hypothetical protein
MTFPCDWLLTLSLPDVKPHFVRTPSAARRGPLSLRSYSTMEPEPTGV